MSKYESVWLSEELLTTFGERALQWQRYDTAGFVLGMTRLVLRQFLGDVWVEQYLNRSSVLNPPTKSLQSRYSREARMKAYELAQMLYNLQGAVGFDGVLARLKAGEIEPTLGELSAGRYLHVHFEHFEFVAPTSLLGNDFDIRVLRETGDICCEVKSKLGFDSLTERGIQTSLERARTQLPKMSPGIIFLRPSNFHTIEETQKLIKIVRPPIRNFLRQTSRVIGVILLTQTYVPHGIHVNSMTSWKIYANSKARHSYTLLQEHSRFPVNYTYFSTSLGAVAPQNAELVALLKEISELGPQFDFE